MKKAKGPHVRSSRVFRSEREPVLFPESVDSRLRGDCPSVQIRSLIGSLDLRDIRELYEDQGGVPYDPSSLLGVLLLGYALNVYSGEGLEDRCRYDLRFMHVSGSQTPSARTIRRFRRRIEPVLESIFTQIVLKCVEGGLAPLKVGALDGSKFASNASQLRRFLKKDSDADSSDPESRLMKGPHGTLRGYNVQALVDAERGVVLAVDVSNAANDVDQLKPVLEKAKEGEALPETVVADAGYDSGENLAVAKGLGVHALIATRDEHPLFWTVVSEEEVVCPMGQPLVQKEVFTGTSGKLVDRYAVQGCRPCIFQNSCLGRSGARTLRVAHGVSPTLRVLNAHSCRSPEGRETMKLRCQTVEPFFGNLKANKRFTRFHLRGLAGARLEILLLAIARNLEILRKAGNSLLFVLYALCRLIQTQNRLCQSL